MPTTPQQRLIISGVCLSPPGTMGGNTKIALEVARHFSLSMKVVFLMPEDKIQTITSNIPSHNNIELLVIPKFRHGRWPHVVHEAFYYYTESKRLLERLHCAKDDLFFTPSDFHLDVFLGFFLKATFKFKWVASVFLFVPSPLENVIRSYGFPFFKYIIYYCYQWLLVCLIKLRSDRVVITNDLDRSHFSSSWKQRLFAFYGGVNVEQIKAISAEQAVTKYDVVFCSRLCVQKGISPFLDIWHRIVRRLPNARLAVIGNGMPSFEKSLMAKADRLNISHTITWLGYVNNEEKYRIYRSSRLFVHPTVYDNNGMVAAEALCTGLPVVMNDLASLTDLYTTGCKKIDFKNQEKTCDLISELLTRADAYAKLKPDPSQVETFQDQWKWDNRCQLFQQFVTQHKTTL